MFQSTNEDFTRLLHFFKLSSKTRISQHIMDTVEEHMERVDVQDNCLYIKEVHLWNRQSKYIQNPKNAKNYFLILLLLPDSLGTFTNLFFRFVYPTDGEFRTIPQNKISNNFRTDSVEVTGDCCFEIGSNSDDYEIVDPENPTDISIFYIHKIYVYNSCPY